ncbi:MAG TPA: septum formation initiator family protein [Candidatus Saccharimonadales bacterium]|nr:septum formation initiator family protein [Candidatus Saccharimonadales bacterium]
MVARIQNALNSKTAKQLLDVRNIGLYIFGVIVVAIAWSSAKAVQNNYQLQRQIATLQQQNTVLQLQNDNTKLQNKYYQTDQYLDLSARQNLGLAAPGEKVLIVPKSVALKYVDPSLDKTDSTNAGAATDNRPKYIKNLEAWRDFLLGRQLFDN